jgi:hypothetical protein
MSTREERRQQWVARLLAATPITADSAPRHHWHSDGNDPLPSPHQALARPLRAFPSWSLRIECGRCGKKWIVNEADAPWRDLWLAEILARARHEGCGGRAAKAELLTDTEAASSGRVRRILLRGGNA